VHVALLKLSVAQSHRAHAVYELRETPQKPGGPTSLWPALS
jgi:hypothetical protein